MSVFDGNQVLHEVSSVEDGNMSFRRGDKFEVLKNRKSFLKNIGVLESRCVCMQVEHGEAIKRVTKDDIGKGMFSGEDSVCAEALISNIRGIYLFLLTADCFPVAYFDPEKKVIALAHLGWKPSSLFLAKKVVDSMRKEFNSNPQNISVVFGPGISKESYKIKEPLQKDDLDWQNFMKNDGSGLISVDLFGFNKKLLLDTGIPEKNIFRSFEDTFSSPNYFSHSRSKKTGEREGRFATVFGLR